MLNAQQISNNLTLLTTDLMSGEEKSNFNWRNLSYTKPAQRFFFPPPIYITAEPDDGVGTGGGSHYNDGYCYLKGGCTGVIEYDVMTDKGFRTCHKCKDGGSDCDGNGNHASLNGSINGNFIFPTIIVIGAGWGSLLWGNLGNYFTTGFLNPPSNGPSGGGYSGYSGGGSATTQPSGTSYPPPNKPIDDPIGGTNNQPIKKDSLPKMIDCQDTIKKLDSILTVLWDSINKLPVTQQCRDSAYYGNHEFGFTTYDSSGYTKTFSSSINGGVNFVAIQVLDTTSGPNHKNINSMTHCHNVGIDAMPEPVDLFNFMRRKLTCTKPSLCNPNIYNQNFFICGDTIVDLALQLTDSMSAVIFFSKYFYNPDSSKAKLDSAVSFDTLQDGTLNPRWSSTFTGFFGSDTISLGDDFDDAVRKLSEAGYSEKLLLTYAQVYMLESRNAGVRIKQFINGKFRQLSCEFTRNQLTGKLETLTIKICN